ncbi:transmembrane and coiled-coil domain-containing protein 4 [Hyalella azteca]|uniref:Transmembrane and coiled-coil domain-containing protein 4 n=1 Tax=Hyalella azteca TaxID=294128 RepID=A0A8B7NSJ6_HYAAZ|nr:transmembrane and coiled-coil domain-containing protein 4 [Hyalella azteca]
MATKETSLTNPSCSARSRSTDDDTQALGNHGEVDMGDHNANSTKLGGGPTRRLADLLSDAGRFAYCGLVTTALQQLFTDTQSDTEFAEHSLQHMLQHLALPKTVADVMEVTLSGGCGTGSEVGYRELLKEEPVLQRSAVPLVQDLVILAVQSGSYDARTRVLIGHVSVQMRVPLDVMEMLEESVHEYLTEEALPTSPEEAARQQTAQRHAKYRRYTMIGLATLGGGAVLGLTGGLAAPFIGAGLGSLLGAGTITAFSSTAGVAVVGSLFGAAGAGLTGFKMKKRVGEVEEFEFEELTVGTSLHVTIAVSGWLSKDMPTFTEPWATLHHSREQYALRYESKYLAELGNTLDYLLQFAFSMAVQESLKYTVLAGIISAVVWPASLVTLASIIDNPWGVCCRRSAQVGRQLATVLLQREHGRRPVTLVGFSLGARVIYYCLEELAQRKNSAGIVQDVILLGAPVTACPTNWKPFGTVVSGRIINGYCQKDWLLHFLYRTSSAELHIAGLEPVKWIDRRMFNFDLSDIVSGHMDYANKLEQILRTLGLRTRDASRADAGLKKSATFSPSATEFDKIRNSRRAQEDAVLKPLRRSFSEPALHRPHSPPFGRRAKRASLSSTPTSGLIQP